MPICEGPILEHATYLLFWLPRFPLKVLQGRTVPLCVPCSQLCPSQAQGTAPGLPQGSGYLHNRVATLSSSSLSKMHDLGPKRVCGKDNHESTCDFTRFLVLGDYIHTRHGAAVSGAPLRSPAAAKTLVPVGGSHLLGQTHGETPAELGMRGRDGFLFLSHPPPAPLLLSPHPSLLVPHLLLFSTPLGLLSQSLER